MTSKKKLEAKIERRTYGTYRSIDHRKSACFCSKAQGFLPVSYPCCSTLLEPFSAPSPRAERSLVCSRQRHPILFTPATPFSCTQKEPAWSMLEPVIYNIRTRGQDRRGIKRMNCAVSIEKGTARSKMTRLQTNVYLFNVPVKAYV